MPPRGHFATSKLWKQGHRCCSGMVTLELLKQRHRYCKLWHRCPNLDIKMPKIVALVQHLWHRCLNLDTSGIIYPERLTWQRCHQYWYRCHHAFTRAVHWSSFINNVGRQGFNNCDWWGKVSDLQPSKSGWEKYFQHPMLKVALGGQQALFYYL